MSLKRNVYRVIVAAVFLMCGLCPAMAQESRKFKVLVVMSYDNDFFWNKETKDGIDSVLGDKCEMTYAYLDTWRSKDNLEKGHAKAKEAYKVYQELQPDGVIASDDNAQSMFVVPYLKDKEKTPVIFCGVNEEMEVYGYPTATITGVREVAHFRESVAFVQQLVPSVRTAGFMMMNRSTAQGFVNQFKKESDTYPVKATDFRLPETLKEANAAIDEFKTQCDALFIDNMQGIPDDKGNPLSEKEAVKLLTRRFGKPAFCCNTKVVEYGVLCAVVKLAKEQAELAANMLMNAMNGMPISQLPVTKNTQGKRMLNITVMKELGIKPRPEVLRNTEFVKTEE